MSTGRRPTIAALLLVLGAATVRAEDEPARNLARLRTIPRAERQALARKLQEFDALGRDQQANLRQLDAQLSELEPAERARYLELAHRYHSWLRRLPEAQRRALAAASPDERLGLVLKLRTEQRQARSVRPYADLLQVSSLNRSPLRATARRLRVWFRLDPKQRAEVQKIKDPRRRDQRFQELARELQIGRELGGQRQEFKAEEEAVRKALGPRLLKRRPNGGPTASPPEAVWQRLAELRYLKDHPPAPIEPRNLDRFESSMPSWIRETLDPLPPDAARQRLRVLYRLVFPEGQEIPEPIKPKAPAAPPPRTAAPPSTTPTPF